jgi:tetratricopeptide (TPR) repeat protein
MHAEQRALEIDPAHAYSWLALGSMQQDLDRLDEAVWCMRKAVEAERGSGKGRTPGSGCPLAECLRRLGRLDEARAECMAALETIEQGDHGHRDVFRCHALIILGRIALDQGDREGAQAAFTQAVAHARGRNLMSAGGHLLVNALAGLARATSDTHSLEEALQLFEKREGYDFGFMAMMGHDSFTLAELAATARALGLEEQAQALDGRAREATLRWRGPPAGVEASA